MSQKNQQKSQSEGGAQVVTHVEPDSAVRPEQDLPVVMGERQQSDEGTFNGSLKLFRPPWESTDLQRRCAELPSISSRLAVERILTRS